MEVTGVCPAGFPHSEICGSKPTCGSPQLFAAGRVLLRQMVPWHPPCALLCLISTPETIYLFCLRCPLPLSPSGFRLPDPASAFLHLRLVFQKNSFLLHVQLSRFGAPHSFGAFRADPENDTASKFFERQSVLFALSSTVFSDRSTLGCALRVSPSDSSLERR